MAAKIFIQKGGQTWGPIAPSDLQKLAQSGKLLPDDLVWQQGSENKVRAKQVKGLSFKTPQADLSNLLQDIDSSPVKDRVPDHTPSSSGKLKKPELPRVSFHDAINSGLQNYATFDGRATRAEYWWWTLFVSLLGAIPILGCVIGFGLFLPTIAMTTRRLHDIGRTGWWQLLFFGIPFIAVCCTIGLFFSALVAGSFSAAITAGTMVTFGCITIVIGTIVSGIWWTIWLVTQGDTGPNRYGPDPR